MGVPVPSHKEGPINSIPEVLLATILGCLDKEELRTARLVCKAFRTASIPCITSLSLACGWEERLDVHEVGLLQGLDNHRLHVLTSVTRIELCIPVDSDVLPVFVPNVLSMLCVLKLHVPADPQNGEAIVATLAAATQLTRLQLRAQGEGMQVAPMLKACSALRHLELVVLSSNYRVLAEAVVEAPKLEALTAYFRNGSDEELGVFWGIINRNATRVPCLRALWGDFPSSEEHLRSLAALTQLTHLCVFSRQGDPLAQLSGLSNLQVLSLPNQYINAADLQKLVAPMKQLRELTVGGLLGRVAEVESLLASLPALSLFGTMGFRARNSADLADAMTSERSYSSPGGGLRVLELSLGEDHPEQVPQLRPMLPGLECLRLQGPKNICFGLLEDLPPTPHLTALMVKAARFPGLARPSARFLTQLPGLKELALKNVLDEEHPEDAVEHIAKLTRLTMLRITSTWYDAPSGGWTTLTSAQLQPLTALRQLRQFEYCGCWDLSKAPDFKKSLLAEIHKMGLRPTIIREE